MKSNGLLILTTSLYTFNEIQWLSNTDYVFTHLVEIEEEKDDSLSKLGNIVCIVEI